MAVSSRITLNHSLIRNLDSAAVRALEMTAEALHTEIVQAQVIPRDTGVLQGEKTAIRAGQSSVSAYPDGTEVINTVTKAENGHISIITEGPQARRLYFHPEYNFQKDENPNAKGHWFEDWLPGGISEDVALKAFEKLYKKEARL